MVPLSEQGPALYEELQDSQLMAGYVFKENQNSKSPLLPFGSLQEAVQVLFRGNILPFLMNNSYLGKSDGNILGFHILCSSQVLYGIQTEGGGRQAPIGSVQQTHFNFPKEQVWVPH